MKNIIMKGLVLLTIYSIFTAFLFFACERFERLENDEKTVSSLRDNTSE